ncbi:hypothetical protein BJ138DRAFT_1154562 [Hygrophoropsis aurantiaca]|uniref:Uncharacterized protein n=1 Tax=Hygrophoropsis aurantiaca TaxID=72124 RepID=A0ACB8A9J4_9AGAM|nr:hypothetical protein BJ138DRAFT_1154562 [Hygrophoropsis aurantiaca]
MTRLTRAVARRPYTSKPIQEPVTPLSVPEAVARAQEQIDKEIASLTKRLLELRSRRNAITCISTLPPELLAKVFMDCAVQAYQRGKYNRPMSLTWVHVTHVCRHWRQVALGFPSLWTLLVPENPRWTEEMLIRSKMAPLVIDVDLSHLPFKNLSDSTSRALKHISRVQELRLVLPPEETSPFKAFLRSPAPLLKSLALSDTPERVAWYPHTTSIQEDLFSGHTPNLRKVSLERCQMSWPSTLLVNLTHLDIRHAVPQFRPSLSQLLSSLNRIPALRSCMLVDALPHFPENVTSVSSVPTEDQVPLLALELLRLEGSLLECVQVLAHLRYPKNAILKLNCFATRPDGQDFSPLFPFISQPGRCNIDSSLPACATFQSMFIYPRMFRSLGSYGVHVWFDTLEQPSGSIVSRSSDYLTELCGADGDCLFALNASWRTHSPMSPIFSICGVLPLSNIRNLVVSNRSELSEGFWSQTFHNSRNLKNITLINSSIQGFVKALAKDALGGHQPGENTILLPSLDSITLDLVHFDETGDIGGYRGVTPMDLRDALTARANQGVEIQRLSITGCCNLSSDDVNLLEKVVVDLVWDSYEHYDEDDEDEEDEDEAEDKGGYYL